MRATSVYDEQRAYNEKKAILLEILTEVEEELRSNEEFLKANKGDSGLKAKKKIHKKWIAEEGNLAKVRLEVAVELLTYLAAAVEEFTCEVTGEGC